MNAFLCLAPLHHIRSSFIRFSLVCRYFFMLNVWFMMHVRVWHMICNALPNFSVSNTPPLPIIKLTECANANGFVVSMHFAKPNTYERKPKHILPFIFVDLVFTICDLQSESHSFAAASHFAIDFLLFGYIFVMWKISFSILNAKIKIATSFTTINA